LKKGIYSSSIIFLFLGVGLFFQDKVCCDETIELKVSHFGASDWVLQRDFLEPWTRNIEKLSNGRVKFTIYPNCQLGPAKEQYDLAVKGVTDIALGVQSYTPERFLLTSVMSLPFMSDSGEKASVVLWSLYNKYLEDEYKDVKVLALFCHGPGQLHTTKKQVKTLEDLKGLKIRMANPFLGKVIERLGATAVICPVTEINEKLIKKELDGVVIVWEAVSNFRFYECKYHTIVNMYTLPFFVVMNKEKYDSLPADIKKLIDENSGKKMSVMAGMAMDNDDIRAKNAAAERGDLIYTLPEGELQRWKKIAMPLGDEWVQDMKAKGLPAQETLVYVVDLFMRLQE